MRSLWHRLRWGHTYREMRLYWEEDDESRWSYLCRTCLRKAVRADASSAVILTLGTHGTVEDPSSASVDGP